MGVRSGLLSDFHPRGDALTEIFVDLMPIFEGPCEYRLRDPVPEVTDDIAHQARTRCIVEYMTHHGAGLTEVVVLGAQCVRFAYHVAVRVPESSLVGAGGVGFGATVRVRSVYRVRHVLYPHCPVLAIAVHRRLRSVHRNLLVIDT